MVARVVCSITLCHGSELFVPLLEAIEVVACDVLLLIMPLGDKRICYYVRNKKGLSAYYARSV